MFKRIDHVESYRGFVFATLNEAPEPLVNHLGQMTQVIDNLVDRVEVIWGGRRFR